MRGGGWGPTHIYALGRPREGLGGLKLDEIDAANSFLMLPMARNGFKWPVKTNFSRKKNGHETDF